ncbi:hypothetical protein [Catenuloplanes atrovinosus]|uniref:Uncharacterized protein n=1 Tax=Catenuloplanes atrovinosus TaxID=137266 RepID=A0AAE3YRC7_9ACTN|nr:hypothetical protein [Catenuloplanes atrovinosus]MDR7278449.1 hypothetical protein [Catenuloplanes atrovinosus]
MTSPTTATPRSEPGPSRWQRWLPLVAGVAAVVIALLASQTPVLDIVKYAVYAFVAVLVPGTLVYRSVRRNPHTLLEDLAMGAAVGICLELAAWAVAAATGVRPWLWLWPLLVIVPFLAVPALRRHWLPRDYAARVPLGFSWTVTGVVVFFMAYLSETFLRRNVLIPTSDSNMQYLDLAYQLSLAGEAKYGWPIHVPQVAEEPLYYHWFAYAHMASTSLIGQIDLNTVAYRLTIPALCALAMVLIAVAGWRFSGRAWIGAGAAVLFGVIGEVNFTDPVSMPLGTQMGFVVWHGMSMIHGWALLIAMMIVLADVIDRRPDRPIRSLGPGAWVLVVVFMLVSSGAKASTIPVVAVGLLITAAGLLIAERRIPWAVIWCGLIAGGAQLLATAVLFHFQAYGVTVKFAATLTRYTGEYGPYPAALMMVLVWFAWIMNLHLRQGGIVALLWVQRGRLDPTQWFLFGGALAGILTFLIIDQPSDGNQYFARTGYTYSVILSVWGFALLLDRAQYSRRAKIMLAIATGVFAVLLTVINWVFAVAPAQFPWVVRVRPIIGYGLVLAAIAVVGAALWWLLARRFTAMRGKGSVVLLAAALTVGAPGLVMDMKKGMDRPNGGGYFLTAMPGYRIDVARWVREHSDPEDVLATNNHCRALVFEEKRCDPRSFWLSAYSERPVLVEGWGFAPRAAPLGFVDFWDQDLLALNDQAFVAPTEATLHALRDDHGVRWLVLDRLPNGTDTPVTAPSEALAPWATLRYDNGKAVVYELLPR